MPAILAVVSGLASETRVGSVLVRHYKKLYFRRFTPINPNSPTLMSASVVGSGIF